MSHDAFDRDHIALHTFQRSTFLDEAQIFSRKTLEQPSFSERNNCARKTS